MKKLLLVAGLLFSAYSFSQGSPDYGAGMKFNLNEDGSKYMRVIAWGQMWGQYNDKDFSLVFGVLFGFFSMKSSYFYFVLRGHLVAMEKSKCEIRHLKWSYDSSIGTKIPSRSSFSAKEGEYEIEFTTHLLYSDDPGMKIHPLLPKVVVSEQIVEYEGVVKSSGEILHSFKGRGFQEWTTKTWRKLSLTF